MSNLKKYRQKLNLTQKELAQNTNISIRTIQRIEAGQQPKGHTLKILAKALQVKEQELLNTTEAAEIWYDPMNKWVNLSALPFILFPPLNIIVPLIVMFSFNALNAITKQIVTIQILWTIVMVILVVLSALIRNAYFLSDIIPPVTLGSLMGLNLFIILRNAIEISKNQKLYIKLTFNFI